MTRYQSLRKLMGCGFFTSSFISFFNWLFGVPEGKILFMNMEIDY